MVQKQVWGMFQNILRRPRRTSCSLYCTVMRCALVRIVGMHPCTSVAL